MNILFWLDFRYLRKMKVLKFIFLFVTAVFSAQNIKSVQLFNPQTNDETPVIKFGEQLVLSFDDLQNSSTIYKYTIKHLDRNWQDDGLFFTEYAKGVMNANILDYTYSFNTYQKYTHYTLSFPNDKIQPKISGNYELIVYKDSASKPLFKKRFCIVEDGANLALNISRFNDAKRPNVNQRVEVIAVPNRSDVLSNLNSISLNVIQNNNFNQGIFDVKTNSLMGNKLLFQQMNLVFPGNNEFYYFDNKIINQAYDMIAAVENNENGNQTYLHSVWAYPLDYQYQPDVNGAYYFRRNDMGIERDANTEADYSWVYFSLDSNKMDKDLYVLGAFNDYIPSEESKMTYDENYKKYIAKIYLKQGFYNYILATKDESGNLNLGEINGSFWQTENLYQAFLYYSPFGKNYDGLIGYGETRKR
jgi:hypothetical protein